MRIESLHLQNFRNIKELTLMPRPGVNVIWGDNGQGKTNLVEGIWMFTGGRSLRGSTQKELICFGCQNARLKTVFEAGGRSQTAEIKLGVKKTASLNDIALKSTAELAGVFPAVIFSPDHLSLVKEGPGERRKFLDDAICQLMPRYQRYLSDYARVLTQRAAVLEEVWRSPSAVYMLEVWDEHFIKLNRALLRMRRRYAQRLAEHATPVYAGISGEKEQFSARYVSTLDLPEELSGSEADEHIRRQLLQVREEDVRMHASTIGVHRDDMEIQLNGNSARSFGSQGQQRSCALALKLAECALLEEVTGERPVILLDDVLSELDSSRREWLLKGIGQSQVFLTCCDPAGLNSLEHGEFHIQDGQLTG